MLDLTGDILAYETGQLDDEEIIELFQNLINNGLAWQLQGSYGRTAVSLLKAGVCTPAQSETEALVLEFDAALERAAEKQIQAVEAEYSLV